MAEMREERLSWVNNSDNIKSLFQGEMRGMLLSHAERIYNQSINSGHSLQCLRIQMFRVSDVGETSNHKPNNFQYEMVHLYGHYFYPFNIKRFERLDDMEIVVWSPGVRILAETVRHAPDEILGHHFLTVNRKSIAPLAIWPEIVGATHMVIMMMGYKQRIKRTESVVAQHLLAEIRTAVNEQSLATGLHKS